ncbi:hypothetical protein PAXRUDRAFT_565547 [Paxillus rubicundulus Ve08.2h10]|uniref:Uncharacterized protein n=1 Tax=Paxillus rubicundulus Ve08.2h10 TaxID=930991 RepID=A0A0D0DM39_9AGAM|nr:hypothetical protein PAXRUDRAFT_565547 [Paxillus rubicundulus Ve08.2h10]
MTPRSSLHFFLQIRASQQGSEAAGKGSDHYSFCSPNPSFQKKKRGEAQHMIWQSFPDLESAFSFLLRPWTHSCAPEALCPCGYHPKVLYGPQSVASPDAETDASVVYSRVSGSVLVVCPRREQNLKAADAISPGFRPRARRALGRRVTPLGLVPRPSHSDSYSSSTA